MAGNEHWDPELEGRIRRAKRGQDQIQEFVVEQATDPLNYLPAGMATKGARMAAKGLFGLAGAQVAREADATVLGPNRIPKEIKDTLRPPRTMEEHGDIFRKTGVHFKGGKPEKYYVPDTGAKLLQDVRNLSEKPEPLSRYFTNPAVFEAVPELSRVRIMAYPALGKNTRAAYSPAHGIVLINPAYMGDPDQVLRSIVHEVQHAAQKADWRTSGGDPDRILNDLRAKSSGASPDELKKQAMRQYRENPGEQEARLSQKWQHQDLRQVPRDQYTDLDSIMRAETEGLQGYLNPFYSDPFPSTAR